MKATVKIKCFKMLGTKVVKINNPNLKFKLQIRILSGYKNLVEFGMPSLICILCIGMRYNHNSIPLRYNQTMQIKLHVKMHPTTLAQVNIQC